MNNQNSKDSSRPEINYALVEGTRPPMYQAMKYWGKKPHNIWSTYIERYCPANGLVLDPFVGSGIAALEAAKLGRKCVAFDLNPLSGFFIEVLTSEFDESTFAEAVTSIIQTCKNDPTYKLHYLSEYENEPAVVFNYRWLDGQVSEIALKTESGQALRIDSRPGDIEKARLIPEIDIPYWIPEDKLPKTPSISHKFIKDLGGDRFADLWTRRNLYLLSLMFHEIEQISSKALQLQLLSAFIQTLHLTCRMVYPRSKSSNRDFSGSWGRADYMIRKKQMEQNPIVVFSRSCFDRQGVRAAMLDAKYHFPGGVPVTDITKSKRIPKRALISYGTVDIADLTKYVRPKSVDFIITDPPYAGLVMYLDLSLVWLTWLQKIHQKYVPDLKAEITVKDGSISREEYRRRLINAFKQLHLVLKDDGKFVVTFHHQEMREWNEFVNAVRLSGFKFDKVTHQYNRRSGESNVANPYGTSGSDFYIRCVKQRDVDFTSDSSGFEHFIVRKTVEIIAARNEPTPYEFIFDGLVPELLQAGLSHPTESHDNVKSILLANSGPGKILFHEENTTTKSGDIWWFNSPSDHISHPNRPLKDRVEDTILALLRREVSVRFDDVIAELFREYPNGLTPDIKAVRPILEKYAFKSSGSWKILDSAVSLATKHTEVLELIVMIGKRSRKGTFIGKREQPESCSNGRKLGELASIRSMQRLPGYKAEQLDRIDMIDALWLNQSMTKIVAAFEVENSTNFISALQRASNLDIAIPKFMVIPDSRESEILSIRDPLFLSVFSDHNWRYVTYSGIEKLAGYSKASLNELQSICKDLK